MPYRPVPRQDHCRYCRRMTALACVQCAHFVCEDCQPTHDEQFEHKSYEG